MKVTVTGSKVSASCGFRITLNFEPEIRGWKAAPTLNVEPEIRGWKAAPTLNVKLFKKE